MEKLFEGWRHFINEKSLGEENGIYSVKNGHTITTRNVLDKLFKFFHLSQKFLGSPVFDFTPRLPMAPFNNDDGDVIEDDFSKRISLAPSVAKALESLEGVYGKKNFFVYAIDLIEIPDDDIETVELAKKVLHCPSSPGNEYGENFSFRKWAQHVDAPTSPKMNRPEMLPEPWRSQFYGCVPDATATQEHWSIVPLKMYYLGELQTDKNTIILNDDGKKVIDRYLEVLKNG